MNDNIKSFNKVQDQLKTGKRYVEGQGVVDIPKDPIPAPTPTRSIDPMSANISRTPGLLDSYKKTASDLESIQKKARAEADLYASNQRQARIDAINTTFAPRIARATKEGEDRLSRVAALNFKSGIIGSGVDTTKISEQTGLNDKQLRAIEEEKALAINEAFGWADALARERAANLTKNETDAANANVAYAKDKVDIAMKALDTFSLSGKITSAKDLKEVDLNTYETLRDVSGMTDEEVNSYLVTHAPKGTYQWDASQIYGSKMVVPTIKNGVASATTIDLGFVPNKKVKSTVETDSGVMVVYDDGTHTFIGTGPKPFTLSAGQTRYDAQGRPIVTSAGSEGDLTPSDKAKGVNYILTNGGNQTDVEKFNTDRAYAAWVMSKLE